MKKIIVLLALISYAYAEVYNIFNGTLIEGNQTCPAAGSSESFCKMYVEPCDENEARRIDGTCNNLDSPVRGASHTPFIHLLPLEFGKDFKPRNTSSGKEFPLARFLRTNLIPDGRQSDDKLTILATHCLLFEATDLASQQDTTNYVVTRNCCSAAGKNDTQCASHKIPDDDPVYNTTDIRCLNMTQPQTFQQKGCLPEGTTPERIISATPWLDLSQLYGFSYDRMTQNIRNSSGGLLKVNVVDGHIWPSTNSSTGNSTTSSNRTCPDTPSADAKSLGMNLYTIWFWRLHNLIATRLSEVNPCWDDDKLFYTAREINIAMFLQIYFYELMPILMGEENLINDEIISSSEGFRDIYDSTLEPQISYEFTYIGRWFHLIQEGTANMYDTDGYYVKSIPISNITFNTGYISQDNHMEILTQGAIRQKAAGVDRFMDPYLGETSMGNLQKAHDLTAQDLAKGRVMGMPSYYKNKEYFGETIECWEDFIDIPSESIETLKSYYDSYKDLELLVGAWMEVPETGYYIVPIVKDFMVEQLYRTIRSDRHWYELEDRPNAFTYEQLQEIRTITMARVLCDVESTVTKIQPCPFLTADSDNEMVECCEIPQMDYQKWKDDACDCEE